MTAAVDVCIYGDSLMKGTVPTGAGRYQFTIGQYLEPLCSRFSLNVLNRARFGAPVTKGAAQLNQDLSRSIAGRYTLLEYGGNDCNFDWAAVSAAPEGEHHPKTPLALFLNTLSNMADTLLRAGSRPVLMTLPPIDAERYLDFIVSRGSSRSSILRWLGDVQRIYRTQERYSNAIADVAQRYDLPCIDVRSLFLESRQFPQLISQDGIHPSESGYQLLYQTLAGFFRTALSECLPA